MSESLYADLRCLHVEIANLSRNLRFLKDNARHFYLHRDDPIWGLQATEFLKRFVRARENCKKIWSDLFRFRAVLMAARIEVISKLHRDVPIELPILNERIHVFAFLNEKARSYHEKVFREENSGFNRLLSSLSASSGLPEWEFEKREMPFDEAAIEERLNLQRNVVTEWSLNYDNGGPMNSAYQTELIAEYSQAVLLLPSFVHVLKEKTDDELEIRLCRLSVEITPTGEFVAIDGQRFEVNAKAAAFIQAAIDADGDFICMSDYAKSRDLEKLPEPIERLLHRDPGKGSRLMPEAWLNVNGNYRPTR